jgi:hypothetical protein
LGRDGVEVLVVALLAGGDCGPLESFEDRQLVAMPDQFFQHYIDDVGDQVLDLGGLLGDVLEPGEALLLQWLDVQELPELADLGRPVAAALEARQLLQGR